MAAITGIIRYVEQTEATQANVENIHVVMASLLFSWEWKNNGYVYGVVAYK